MHAFDSRGEYTNLGQEADDSEGQAPVRDKQQQDNDNPNVASRGDTHQLEGATQGGLHDQPSLAFFPADKTGYIAKVSCTALVDGNQGKVMFRIPTWNETSCCGSSISESSCFLDLGG